MADVNTPRELLVMALQDLLDGEKALAKRLGAMDQAARDEAFKVTIREDRSRSEMQRDRLIAILDALNEPLEDSPNIWLRAILDDADNDAETIAAGPLRDTALLGALRKGKQSERVSYETALALAERLGLDDVAGDLRRSRDEEQAADDQLADMLVDLVSRLEPSEPG